MDSVCAPFLVNFFDREDLAFGCFLQFMTRILSYFYCQSSGNEALMSSLTVHGRLLNLLDPSIMMLLIERGISPDMYAVSWYMTAFAHVLSMTGVMKVFDALILSHSPLILLHCITVSIMTSIKLEAVISPDGITEQISSLSLDEILSNAHKILIDIPKSVITYPRSSGSPWNIPDPMLTITPASSASTDSTLPECPSCTVFDDPLCSYVPRIHPEEISRMFGEGAGSSLLVLDIRSCKARCVPIIRLGYVQF